MKPGDPDKLWKPIQNFLQNYQYSFSPVRWFGNLFEKREGWYVLLRMVVLLIALKIMFIASDQWSTPLLLIVPSAFLPDILLFNTSVAVVTRRPVNSLRSIVLTFLSYMSIGICFAVFCAWMRDDFQPKLSSAHQALYFSFVTMTTLGYGDIDPLLEKSTPQFVVIFELGVSLYFLAILLARVIMWHGEPQAYEKRL